MKDKTDFISKIDLHIHSYISSYKEEKNLLINSTIDNLDILFAKLNEQEVNLISFTDHNRFDLTLFNAARKIIIDNKDKTEWNVKNIIPGVEIDVELEKGLGKCQINAYFDYKNEEDLKRIEKAFSSENEFQLKKKEEFYDKDQLWKVFTDIGLDIILIGAQTKSLENKKKDGSNISPATSNPYEYIRYSFFDALEFSSTSKGNEGVLKFQIYDELNINDFPLITKSDCHDWKSYPWKDEKKLKEAKENNSVKKLTKIKALPSFLGLKIALSLPETRINKIAQNNNSYIESINWNDTTFELAKGVNVIIGDNASGKSALVAKIANNAKEIKKYENFYNPNNKIYINSSLGSPSALFIEQGKILMSANQEDGNFFEMLKVNSLIIRDYSEFDQNVNEFKVKLENVLKFNINRKSAENKINALNSYSFKKDLNFFHITIDQFVQDKENVFYESLSNYKIIIDLLKKEADKQIYDNLEQKTINETIKNLSNIRDTVESKFNLVELQNSIVNKINGKIRDYTKMIKERTISLEDDDFTEIENRSKIKKSIIDYISIKKPKIFELPFVKEPLKREFTFKKSGFVFSEVPKYASVDISDEIYERLFTKNLNDKREDILTIDNEELLKKYMKNVKKEDVWTHFDSVVNVTRDSLKGAASRNITHENGKNIKNSPGEISLAFYDFQLSVGSEDKNVIIIDQPEDHISNKNIRQNLIKYINSIRNEKQIIIVTHNPLLIVNLDADNVVFLERIGRSVSLVSGPLEYESDTTKMLDIIRDNVEGGADAIEKRFKIYGKK